MYCEKVENSSSSADRTKLLHPHHWCVHTMCLLPGSKRQRSSKSCGKSWLKFLLRLFFFRLSLWEARNMASKKWVRWTQDLVVLVPPNLTLSQYEVFLELIYFWISQGPPCLFTLLLRILSDIAAPKETLKTGHSEKSKWIKNKMGLHECVVRTRYSIRRICFLLLLLRRERLMFHCRWGPQFV